MTHKPFSKILIANRGEIARRIIRTAKRLGIWTIAVYSEADANALFVEEADEKHLIGPPPPKESYLRIDRILEVAKQTGARAIHPGYGFLSENPTFARAVREAEIVFVGPPPEAMEKLGGKLDARRLAKEVDVPLVPGTDALASVADAREAAKRIGYPVMLKAAAGGGGIGMAVVQDEARLDRAFEDAVKKGQSFFGSGTVYLEKLVEKPAHVEVQVFVDRRGQAVAVGERDCTVQRRNQKVLEETPSPRIDRATREKMFEAALRIVKAAGYENAGTVEMIVGGAGDSAGKFYFLEVNTRLQVEHPVTELVTGIDHVEAQLRIAAGEPMPVEAARPVATGHAIEARICAEDPDRMFLPSPGTVSKFEIPEGVRVDAAIASGRTVPSAYDSLIAKVIAHGATRPEAIEKLRDALARSSIEGIKTNLSMFARVLTSPSFVAGTHDTGLLKSELGYKF